MSSRIKYDDGRNRSAITVENKIPKANEIAIGIKNCAWILFSNNRGVNPRKVVTEVRIIALNLAREAFLIALRSGRPSPRVRLM